jgi:hypothetical protein
VAGCTPEERTALLNRLRVRDENGFRTAETSIDAALEDHRVNGCCVWRADPLVAAAPARRSGQEPVVVFCAVPGADRGAERQIAARLAEAVRAIEQSMRAEA